MTIYRYATGSLWVVVSKSIYTSFPRVRTLLYSPFYNIKFENFKLYYRHFSLVKSQEQKSLVFSDTQYRPTEVYLINFLLSPYFATCPLTYDSHPLSVLWFWDNYPSVLLRSFLSSSPDVTTTSRYGGSMEEGE